MYPHTSKRPTSIPDPGLAYRPRWTRARAPIKRSSWAPDSAGNNAFLTGPIVIPTGVTLLVDPGVTLYFSRNAQDYDKVQGVHTCGTVSAASNTASCKNLVSISNANNSGVMGCSTLNARGGVVVLNSFPTAGYEGTTAGKSWWDLASDANTLGASQQNPRGIQISNSTNITLYKITFKNPPNFSRCDQHHRQRLHCLGHQDCDALLCPEHRWHRPRQRNQRHHQELLDLRW